MLIKRILDSDTMNSNGTMTYALGELDCKHDLVSIFRILTTQSYESKCHAYDILSEHEFEFTPDDLNMMTRIWNGIKLEPKETQNFDTESLKMMKDVYDGFLEYNKF